VIGAQPVAWQEICSLLQGCYDKNTCFEVTKLEAIVCAIVLYFGHTHSSFKTTDQTFFCPDVSFLLAFPPSLFTIVIVTKHIASLDVDEGQSH